MLLRITITWDLSSFVSLKLITRFSVNSLNLGFVILLQIQICGFWTHRTIEALWYVSEDKRFNDHIMERDYLEIIPICIDNPYLQLVIQLCQKCIFMC